MDVPILIGMVMAITELIKKGLLKYLHIEVKAKAAVVLAVLVSIGVVFVQALKGDITITLALVPTLIQVILGSTIGYAIVTKKST